MQFHCNDDELNGNFLFPFFSCHCVKYGLSLASMRNFFLAILSRISCQSTQLYSLMICNYFRHYHETIQCHQHKIEMKKKVFKLQVDRNTEATIASRQKKKIIIKYKQVSLSNPFTQHAIDSKSWG